VQGEEVSSFRKQTDARYRGYTLLELTIAVALMVVVVAFFAPILHAVQKSWAVRAGNSETLAQARAFVHHFHQRVSQASHVSAVTDSTTTKGHLQLVESDGTKVRYDVYASGNIRFGPVGEEADLAGPVSEMRLTCYDGNDCTVPITDCNAIRLVHVDATFANTAGADLTVSTSAYIRAGAVRDEGDREEDKGVFQPGVALKQ
jgi:prepilin-type N-terminal cleavage/methylation domain-containing protein